MSVPAPIPDAEVLLVPHQHQVPSDGGVLLIGREREVHVSDAWIQAGRFKGAAKTSIVDSAALHGPLPKVIEAAFEFVRKHGLHGFDIGAVRRTDTWSAARSRHQCRADAPGEPGGAWPRFCVTASTCPASGGRV